VPPAEALKTRFLRDALPVRLGNLASSLARLGAFAESPAPADAIEEILEECEYFVEWSGPDAPPETQVPLVDLQVQLALWRRGFRRESAGRDLRSQIARESRDWSDRVLSLSGLLDRPAGVREVPSYPYTTHLDVRYGPLEVVDLPALVAACTDRWYNQTLCRVNDSVVRLGVIQGEYHWHKHDDLDEFFYVVEGRLLIDLEDRTVTLAPRQGFVVPKTVRHRTRAPERTVILMVEGAGIVPTGD
jgi:hypothetical protein